MAIVLPNRTHVRRAVHVARNLPAMARSAAGQLVFVPRTLRLIWAAARGWMLVWLALLALDGLLAALNIWMTQQLIDSLIAAFGPARSEAALHWAGVLAAITFGMMIGAQALRSFNDWVRTLQAELVQDHISGLIHQQSVAVDLAFYESPEYHDQLYQARADSQTRPLALLDNIGGLLRGMISLLAMGVLLLAYGGWLPLLLIVSAVPAMGVAVLFNYYYQRWWRSTIPARRWVSYYDIALTDSYYAPEMRLFGLDAYFRPAFQRLRASLRKQHMRHLRAQTSARLLAWIVSLAIMGLSLGWMGMRALQGAISVGELVLFYQAFNMGQAFLQSLMGNLEQIYSNSMYLRHLFAFFELRPRIADPPEPVATPAAVEHAIRFEHVTFRYPNSQRVALENFSLELPAGRIVALVGVNGAGKSTLVKLLCRFYDPEAGRITLDGVDIREFRLAEYRRLISVLFQYPVNYHATAAESIAIGNLSVAQDRVAIEAAARGAGANEVIGSLPQGYDTLLGKWFNNGEELSGGQWQRVALARAYYRSAPILILDEPTSHMDSWTEAEWFEHFKGLAEGRTGLVITHRFTIARRADLIHVIEGGQIAESGTHDQLLARGGRYAGAWYEQIAEHEQQSREVARC